MVLEADDVGELVAAFSFKGNKWKVEAVADDLMAVGTIRSSWKQNHKKNKRDELESLRTHNSLSERLDIKPSSGVLEVQIIASLFERLSLYFFINSRLYTRVLIK